MPNVFDAGNDELEALREDPSLQHLLAYFDARTAEWPHSIKEMELFTVGVFFDLASSFKNDQAFELLKIAAQFPWNELPDHRFLLGIDLLADLALASGTTELPDPLAEKWNDLASRVASLDPSYGAWTALTRHYHHEA